MIERLRLAEELQAATCVNILGTKRIDNWYGPCKEGYSEEFFEEAVQVCQRVIDAVQPQHTRLSFEMMPYYFLDGPEAYLKFLNAVDRPGAAIHLDLCNTINRQDRLYNSGTYIKHVFELLKDRIVTLHLKDIALKPDVYTMMFEEVLIGKGNVDYVTFLREIAALPEDTPAMLEHLSSEEEYEQAAEAVKAFAYAAGLKQEGLVWR